ncbi:hypothetical protein VTH06DRAFT_2569 [Thermothelomyces fergusii]
MRAYLARHREPALILRKYLRSRERRNGKGKRKKQRKKKLPPQNSSWRGPVNVKAINHLSVPDLPSNPCPS